MIKWFPTLNVSTPNIGASILKGRVFEWNELMEEEFIQVQKKIGEPHILSPFDRNRETGLYTDASRLNGLGYLLIQENKEGRKYLIACGSSKVTQAQSGYSTTELELSAASWAINKCRFWLKGCM